MIKVVLSFFSRQWGLLVRVYWGAWLWNCFSGVHICVQQKSPPKSFDVLPCLVKVGIIFTHNLVNEITLYYFYLYALSPPTKLTISILSASHQISYPELVAFARKTTSAISNFLNFSAEPEKIMCHGLFPWGILTPLRFLTKSGWLWRRSVIFIPTIPFAPDWGQFGGNRKCVGTVQPQRVIFDLV